MKRIISQLKSLIRGEQNLKKLIKRGLIIGERFKRMDGVIIDPSHCWHISIGNNVTLAPRVHILAHDTSTKLFLNYTRVANTRIGNDVFIGASSIILPGVTIGDRVIIGAGSVVSNDIPSNCIAAGNPARVVKSLDTYLKENKTRMNANNMFGEEYTLRDLAFDKKKKEELIKMSERDGFIFVE